MPLGIADGHANMGPHINRGQRMYSLVSWGGLSRPLSSSSATFVIFRIPQTDHSAGYPGQRPADSFIPV